MNEHLPYLKTLRRIPDDVILSMGMRDMDLGSPNRCVCGWALRESLAQSLGMDAAKLDLVEHFDYGVTSWVITEHLVKAYGGEQQAWQDIYWGVTEESRMPDIELAFVLRMDEACRPRRRTSKRSR